MASTIGRIALLFVAHAVGTANITLVIALSPSIEESLGLGHAGFGLMISAYYGAMLVLALPAGWLVDRFGLRTMLVIAHVLLASGLLMLARARGLPTGALGLVLCGGGYALINPATARAVLGFFLPRLSPMVLLRSIQPSRMVFLNFQRFPSLKAGIFSS